MTFGKYILTIAILVTSLSCLSQDNTRLDSIAKIKGVLQKDNIVATQGVGYAGMPSRHWYSFAYLLWLCTDEELVQMTYDSSPAVRLYSYIALVHKKYSNLPTIEKRLSLDTAQLSSIEGCILDKTAVAKGVASINNWYHEKSTNAIIMILQKDAVYRMNLYGDIIDKKSIRRYTIK